MIKTLLNIFMPVIIIFFLTIFLIIFYYTILEYGNIANYGFLENLNTGGYPWNHIVLAVFTIMGIFSRVLFDEIKKSKDDQIIFIESIKKSFRAKEFWMALCICPIIIGYVFNNFIAISNKSSLALIAYQNGFFFESIFALVSKDGRLRK